jgi:DNA modification methylase
MLPAGSVQCVVTSPPYWGLRDYGVAGQLGLEPTPEAHVAAMVDVFRAVRRVLRDDGTLWLNLGDSYANTGPGSWGSSDKSTLTTGSRHGAWAPGKTVGTTPRRELGGLKPKDLVGMPWRLAFALQADGWYLRADIIWAKPNPMPESVTDRPTKAHEYVFLLSKKGSYFYDADAVREPSEERASGVRNPRPNPAALLGRGDTRHTIPYEPNGTGRNLRSVWTLATEPTPEAHFATFPTALASRCIQAGSSEKGCCAACGAPWACVVDAESIPDPRPMTTGAAKKAALGDMARTTPQGRTCGSRLAVTTGWQPSCACEAPTVPCTVLDPFGGSGTVGQVAERLGRHSILIELSPAYVRIAEARTAQLGLFARAIG